MSKGKYLGESRSCLYNPDVKTIIQAYTTCPRCGEGINHRVTKDMGDEYYCELCKQYFLPVNLIWTEDHRHQNKKVQDTMSYNEHYDQNEGLHELERYILNMPVVGTAPYQACPTCYRDGNLGIGTEVDFSKPWKKPITFCVNCYKQFIQYDKYKILLVGGKGGYSWGKELTKDDIKEKRRTYNPEEEQIIKTIVYEDIGGVSNAIGERQIIIDKDLPNFGNILVDDKKVILENEMWLLKNE